MIELTNKYIIMFKNMIKFSNGQLARKKWTKDINVENLISIDLFNLACGNIFKKNGNILLDLSKRQTTICVVPDNINEWIEICEKIYIITKDDKIVKIGGTRNGMKNRFSSYLCGHHVCERNKSGKMSITNAHLYHTIEHDLLENNSSWNFYTWKLPIIQHTINIFGIETTITLQTYHAYESCCINKYKEIAGNIPILCDNYDPLYKH